MKGVELILMAVDPLGSWSVTDVEGISTTRGGGRLSRVCARDCRAVGKTRIPET